MTMIKTLFARFRGAERQSGRPAPERLQHLQNGELVRAHGDWLALLATILERERVISGCELARLLSEYAVVTAADRPQEGRILAYWAARLQDTAASLEDFPLIH